MSNIDKGAVGLILALELASLTDIRDVLEVGHNNHTFSIPECYNVAMSIEKILTLLDSGASDHCFITKSWFSSYNMISPPRRGNVREPLRSDHP